MEPLDTETLEGKTKKRKLEKIPNWTSKCVQCEYIFKNTSDQRSHIISMHPELLSSPPIQPPKKKNKVIDMNITRHAPKAPMTRLPGNVQELLACIRKNNKWYLLHLSVYIYICIYIYIYIYLCMYLSN